MPVSMNEPLSALQRIAEMMCICYPYFTKAAEHPDSMMRLALSLTGLLACCNIARTRKRKPFDSMIGETYEFVTDKMKFVSEQVQYEPLPLACFHLETELYVCTGYTKIDEPKFSFWSGRGRFDIQ